MKEFDPVQTVLVTDIAASNAGTLLGGGTSTLPALIDLANICQAVVMHDVVLVSPVALENNQFLKELDNTYTVDTRVSPDGTSEIEAAQGETVSLEEARESLPEELDNPLLDVWLQSFRIRAFDSFFASIVNPAMLGEEVDRGLHLVRKLPLALRMLQASHGRGDFVDDGVREDFLARARPTLDRFDRYAASLTHLYRECGIDCVASILEQSFVDGGRVGEGIKEGELGSIPSEILGRIDVSVEKFRCLALEEYAVPAIGLHVLSATQDLGQLKQTLERFRTDFGQLRETIVGLEKERWAAMSDPEAGRRDIARITENLSHAFAAFERQIRDPYIDKDIKHARRLLNGAKLFDKLFELVTSMGVNALKLQQWLRAYNVENRLDQSVIPGLFKAGAVINTLSIPTVSDVVARHLRISRSQLHVPAFTLKAYIQGVDSCYGIGDPDDEPGFTIDDGEFVPASRLWTMMLRELGQGESTLVDGFITGMA